MVLQKGGTEGEGKPESEQGACMQLGSGLIPEHSVLRGAGVDLAQAQAQARWEGGSYVPETFSLR